MHLDHARCATAVRSKAPRFDGVFVTGVLSTGIYCRPSCPAITPKVVNMRFYPSAAAAQSAGFRACKRCRPDAFPASDLGVRMAARAAGLPGGASLVRHAEAWRPWRSYATQLQWASTGHEVAHLPKEST